MSTDNICLTVFFKRNKTAASREFGRIFKFINSHLRVGFSHCLVFSSSYEPLSSAEASYFFVRAGNWGEVKSKRAKPGETSPFPSFPALPLFFIFRVFRLPPLKEPLRRREVMNSGTPIQRLPMQGTGKMGAL